MQVTALTMDDQLAGDLNADQATINTLDEELSSGNAIEEPSDNPIATADSITYDREIALNETYQNNATTAQAWLGLGNDTANSVISTLQSVQTLVTQALNSGGENDTSYNEMAEQVQGDLTQLVDLANTTYGATPIFAGTAGVSQPYSPTGVYSGNSSPFTISVDSGTPVAVSVTGSQMFGGGTSGVQSVFTTLANIVTDLQAGTGSTANLETDAGALSANITQADSAATTLGESTDLVAAASSTAQQTSTQLQQVLGTVKNTNVPTVTSELESDLTTYQAALEAVSQAVPESLAQYIH
jgi:flagellar hook-associated protein 3 FlgL